VKLRTSRFSPPSFGFEPNDEIKLDPFRNGPHHATLKGLRLSDCKPTCPGARLGARDHRSDVISGGRRFARAEAPTRVRRSANRPRRLSHPELCHRWLSEQSHFFRLTQRQPSVQGRSRSLRSSLQRHGRGLAEQGAIAKLPISQNP